MVERSWEWMGTRATYKYLGITLRTLYRLIDVGDIPAHQLRRVIRLRKHELDEYLEPSKVHPGQLSASPAQVADEVARAERRDLRAIRARLDHFVAAFATGTAGPCPPCSESVGVADAAGHLLGHR